MKKALLIVFILVDVVLIMASGAFLAARLKSNRNPLPGGLSPAGLLNRAVSPQASTSTVAAPGLGTTAGSIGMSIPPNGRKILFSYRSSRAKSVKIRADFTGWRAEPMEKDPSGIWKYTAALEPGEYAYIFSVDDKSVRDPSNKRTKKVGTTVVSAIDVATPASKRP